MATKRLIGSDGKLTVGSFGTEIIAAATLTEGTWYMVTAIDETSSAFPAGAMVGFMYKADGTEVLETDDKAKPWSAVDMCDIQNWSMSWASSEVAVTTFCDDYNVYRKGKDDITGSVNGVFTIGVTDMNGGFQNQFVDIVNQDGSAYTITLAKGAVIIAQLYVDKTTTVGEAEAFYLVPMSLTGFEASAGGEDAQAFSSPFRVAPIDGSNMAFYSYTNQA